MANNRAHDSADRFSQIFERHPSAQLLVDIASGQIVDANSAATAFCGYGVDRLRQLKLSELFIADDEGASPVWDLLAGASSCALVRQRSKEQNLRHVEIEAAIIDDTDDRSLLHAVMHDVSDRIRAERGLRVYTEIYDHLPVPLYRATRGASGRFVRFNPAFLKLFDADTPEQLFERDISSLYVDPHDRERFSNALMQHGEVYRYELQLRTLKGRIIHCIDTAYQHRDEEGQHVFDGVLEDVTRERELERELSYQAHHDELTGLYNRRHCDQLMESEIERCDRYGQPLSVLMFDLDHFKRINDEYGHAAGDQLLKEISETVRHHVRQSDILGRWGGEEFAVILPSTNEQGAAQLAEMLRRSVADLPRAGQQSGVTISVGYAEYHRGEGRESFLGRVDKALYTAKNEGRDRIAAAPLTPGPGHIGPHR